MTPSALSRTIQRLEEEVGKPLFYRDNRSVSLTPAGVIFQSYAEEVLQRWQGMMHQMAAGEELRGEISLYCSVTAAHSILPRMLGTFRAAHPGVQLKLQTGDAAMALGKLLNREAEVTIAALPENLPSSIAFIELTKTPLVFIAPIHCPEIIIYRKQAIDWQATPIILAEQGLSRISIDRWFKQQKVEPNVYAQVAGNEALLAMVSLGCGVGVVPRLVLEKSPLQDQVAILDIPPPCRRSLSVPALLENTLNDRSSRPSGQQSGPSWRQFTQKKDELSLLAEARPQPRGGNGRLRCTALIWWGWG